MKVPLGRERELPSFLCSKNGMFICEPLCQNNLSFNIPVFTVNNRQSLWLLMLILVTYIFLQLKLRRKVKNAVQVVYKKAFKSSDSTFCIASHHHSPSNITTNISDIKTENGEEIRPK